MNYKLLIAYDGTRYKGWQRLKDNENTIQGKIESVLSLRFKRETEINGASRTDAGVHATAQVANVTTKTVADTAELKHYLNKYLPDDIVVKEVTEALAQFHARYNCVRKTYKYTIWTNKAGDPFTRKYYAHIPEYLDLELMQQAATILLGEHDFTAFTNAKSKKKTMVRTLEDIRIDGDLDKLEIYLTADGFLHNMARKIIGLLVDIGSGQRPVTDAKKMLDSKDRAFSSFVAPAQGLCLVDVEYK